MTFSNLFDGLGELDWLAVLVGSIAMFVVGWLWYGPLFGKKWAAERGIAMGGGTPEPKVMALGFVQVFLLNIGVAFFIPALHFLFQNPASFETLVVSAFALAFFVVGAVLLAGVVYLKQSWTLWGIEFGYYFIGIAVAAYVQDLMA